MITQTVNEPDTTVNAPCDEQTQVEAKPAVRAANNSWLRYPLLVMTFLLLVVLTLKAKELTQDILAAVGPVEEWLSLPF